MDLGKFLADPDKLSVLERMSPPKTKRDVRKILGFFGYFRDHIPNFAEIALPLTDLTTKQYQKAIPWGEPQQTAFENLKRALKEATENPQYSVDFSKPFYLFTDASNYAVSGALTQMDKQGKYLPIAFSSTKLTETQKKWSVIEKEAFAVLEALRKYRQWIFGTTLTVMSDHNPLTYLTHSVPKSAKLMRWALALQEFSINFEYYPGKKNIVADCLSRIV